MGEVANDRQNTGDSHARVKSLVDALADVADAPPRVVTGPGFVRAEIDVTPSVTERWRQVLAVLDRGDTYGLTDTERGQVAWVRLVVASGAGGDTE